MKDFSLPDQHGKTHTLSQYKGQWVVLYFYPKDDTPGCSKEACNFQADLSFFEQRKIALLGVSKDTAKSHGKFAEKYGLQFPLLSDPTHKVIEAYGAWGQKKFMGREFDGTLRQTVIINPEGEVVQEFENVDPVGHSQEIQDALQKLLA